MFSSYDDKFADMAKRTEAKMLTREEIFDKVETHLLRQNAKAHAEEGSSVSCLYRAPYGRKCAAGCLILDEFYDAEELEGKNVSGRAVQLALIKSGVNIDDTKTYELVFSLQRVHDDLQPTHWESRLKEVHAHHFGS